VVKGQKIAYFEFRDVLQIKSPVGQNDLRDFPTSYVRDNYDLPCLSFYCLLYVQKIVVNINTRLIQFTLSS
jgi:hypothetical protein